MSIKFLPYQFYLLHCNLQLYICTFLLNVLILGSPDHGGLVNESFMILKPPASHRHYSKLQALIWGRQRQRKRKRLDQDRELEHLRNAGKVSIILFSHVTNENETKKQKVRSNFRNFVCQKRSEIKIRTKKCWGRNC